MLDREKIVSSARGKSRLSVNILLFIHSLALSIGIEKWFPLKQIVKDEEIQGELLVEIMIDEYGEVRNISVQYVFTSLSLLLYLPHPFPLLPSLSLLPYLSSYLSPFFLISLLPSLFLISLLTYLPSSFSPSFLLSSLSLFLPISLLPSLPPSFSLPISLLTYLPISFFFRNLIEV